MTWLDLARAGAVFTVVLLHVAALELISSPPGSVNWWAANIYDSASRWSVPVLVMVSGALLLAPDKSQDIVAFYRRRAQRIGPPLVFWTVVYLALTAWQASVAGAPVPISALLLKAISGTPYYHLWFLYMLAGLYLVAPFVQRAISACTAREVLLLVILTFVLAAIWQADTKLGSNDPGVVTGWFLRFLPLFVFGYYLRITDRHPGWPAMLSVFLASVLATSIGFWFIFGQFESLFGFYMFSYLSVSVIPMSISAIFILKTIDARIGAPRKWIGKLAALSFGIYLIHPLVIELVAGINDQVQRLGGLVSIPVFSVLVFLVSAALSALVRRIPFLRRTV